MELRASPVLSERARGKIEVSTSPETTSDVVIAGAGIACLTAALTLNAQGIRPVILESTREIKPLGVGINLQPPAVEVLTRLGLREHLEKLGVPTSSARYLAREGTLLAERTFSPEEQQIAVHRGELQNMLLDTVLERLGSDAVRTGQRVEGSS